ncbi:hypothetical protein M885DRAFT_537969 [Pelagophyceae sp. CCMP2097]|nr:hypothetical protein M885DRAFT_537969 [Pelagophyceae sp. CCMP2097]
MSAARGRRSGCSTTMRRRRARRSRLLLAALLPAAAVSGASAPVTASALCEVVGAGQHRGLRLSGLPPAAALRVEFALPAALYVDADELRLRVDWPCASAAPHVSRPQDVEAAEYAVDGGDTVVVVDLAGCHGAAHAVHVPFHVRYAAPRGSRYARVALTAPRVDADGTRVAVSHGLLFVDAPTPPAGAAFAHAVLGLTLAALAAGSLSAMQQLRRWRRNAAAAEGDGASPERRDPPPRRKKSR